MKIYLITLVTMGFSFIVNEIEAQKNKPTIDTTYSLDKISKLNSTYFILGTLNDYMGRYQYVGRNNQVDRYYPYEKPLMLYLDSLIENDFHIKLTTVKNETFSKDLSTILNSFYNDQDRLIDSLFKSTENINSFLSGVYYRFGEKINSSIYKIQLANSSKHQICYKLLKRTGCNKIFYKYLKNIPAQFIFYFEPTEELRCCFDKLTVQKKKLDDSYEEQIQSRYGMEIYGEMKKYGKKRNLLIGKLLK
ncbi:MAG: hypothetical protein ABFS35_03045 [Bacteroidota bacterium]